MISIEELTIGSHVLYGGERVEVRIIASTKIAVSTPPYLGLVKTTPADLSPIPVTEELLGELGFEYDDALTWRKILSNDYLITCNMNGCVCVWRLENGNMVEDLASMYCYDLHTLEAFVYLTTKQRLI